MAPLKRSAGRKSKGGIGSPKLWIGVSVVVFAVVMALGFGIARDMNRPAGQIIPDRTFHDFGSVQMNDGFIAARFALEIEGTVQVAEISTA